ncbi:hypothetical protein CF15_01995 [Pyrodictium occultum]|uniref:Metal-dependent hydrolase n=1 Tax=Pyrodictium occultum TaxID=2309 RepID=A0A0V8RUF1_PYROC|nr:hypothetical protein CF15_01995 [Pyrodictium occultum]
MFAVSLAVTVMAELGEPPGAVMLASTVAALAAAIPDLDLHTAHRALLHNVPVMLALTILAYAASLAAAPWAAWLVAAGFLLGYSSHLLLDMLTVRGVALLYPFQRRFYRLARLRSSDPLANKLLQAASAAVAAYSLASAGMIGAR